MPFSIERKAYRKVWRSESRLCLKKKIARSLVCLESRVLKEGRVGEANLRDKRQENR